MRLDHLLSREEEVRVGLLLSCQGKKKGRNESNEKLETEFLADAAFAANHSHKSTYESKLSTCFMRLVLTHCKRTNSGGDALRGNTRFHPEHDG